MKGFENFREKTPAFSGKKILILPICVIFMAVVAFFVYITFDSLPATLTAAIGNGILLSFMPLLGIVVMECAGLLLVWQLWFWRDRLKTKYGSRAYQRIFLLGFIGIILILTIAINQFIPYYLFAPKFWQSAPLGFLAKSLEIFVGTGSTTVFFAKEALSVILLIIGLLMCTRAIQVFGFDYMVVLYLYFPEESHIQKNEIYSVLRHPTYAGAIVICLGGAFFTFTVLSFVAFVIFLLGFYIHVYFVEEKELIQRFGDSYRNYRKEVPAFFINPRNINALFRFLFKREAIK